MNDETRGKVDELLERIGDLDSKIKAAKSARDDADRDANHYSTERANVVIELSKFLKDIDGLPRELEQYAPKRYPVKA